MIITCKECNTSFKLDENLLKATGSKVRCSKCHKVFVVYPPKPLEEPEKPAEIMSDIKDEQVTSDLEISKTDAKEPDGLDLSDVEKFFEEESIREEAIDGLDLDLNFDLDIEPETEKPLEDIKGGAKGEEPKELDLSDLDKIFEEEALEDETSEDFNLDLDIGPISHASAEDIEAGAKPEELDLSDLEEILDSEEPEYQESPAPEDVELELDMDTEPELENMSEGVTSEELEEVDLSDIEKMLEIEEAPETEQDTQPEDIDLDFEIEEESADNILAEDALEVEAYEPDEIEGALETGEATETEGLQPEFKIEADEQEEPLEEEIPDVQPALKRPGPAVKKRIGKPVLVLIIIALLTGGFYGTYVLLDSMDIKIPFISDYLKPKDSDIAGNLKIDTLDVNSKFIENAKTGKLFIITGRIKNKYPDVRRYVRITGKLYTKGKVLAQTETVFCGNVLSDIELSNMKFDAIKKRLLNSLGDNKSNTNIKSGQELPFMVVFANLPDKLEEFSIEVVGSSSK